METPKEKIEYCYECKILKAYCTGLCFSCYIKEYPDSLAAKQERGELKTDTPSLLK